MIKNIICAGSDFYMSSDAIVKIASKHDKLIAFFSSPGVVRGTKEHLQLLGCSGKVWCIWAGNVSGDEHMVFNGRFFEIGARGIFSLLDGVIQAGYDAVVIDDYLDFSNFFYWNPSLLDSKIASMVSIDIYLMTWITDSRSRSSTISPNMPTTNQYHSDNSRGIFNLVRSSELAKKIYDEYFEGVRNGVIPAISGKIGNAHEISIVDFLSDGAGNSVFLEDKDNDASVEM